MSNLQRLLCHSVRKAALLCAILSLLPCAETPAADGPGDRAVQAVQSGEKTVYGIRAFGAVGDGKTLDTIAINDAIAACSQGGGGTVYVPAGTYLCGSIHLTNNLNLFLDAGAVILGAPQNMDAYDEAEPWE